jgi:hypothetical protein
MSRLNEWLDQWGHDVEEMLSEHSKSTSHAVAYVDLMKHLQKIRDAEEKNNIEKAVLRTSAFTFALQRYERILHTPELRMRIEGRIEEEISESHQQRSALEGAHTPHEQVHRLARALWHSGEYEKPWDAAKETLKRAGYNPGEFGPKENLPSTETIYSHLNNWINRKNKTSN